MCDIKYGYILIERLYMSKNIYYLSLLLCIVFVSNAMEQIEEVLSPAVRREIEGEPALIDRSRFIIDKRDLARQTRQKLAAVQDLNFSGRMQALQRLVCTPSSQEQEADLLVSS